jgi:lysophospholipase L1-like esterase
MTAAALCVCGGWAGARAEIRVACVGNSITEGYGLDNDESYPARLQEMLGDSFTVGNFGEASCGVIRKGLEPYWETGDFRAVFDFDPHIVVILLGTVDTKDANWDHQDDFYDDYAALVDTFATIETVERFFLCLPPPIAQTLNTMDDHTLITELIPIIEQVAADKGHVAVNVYDAMDEYPDYYNDGVHPDSRGARVIATTVHEAILEQQQTAVAPRAAVFATNAARGGRAASGGWFTLSGRAVSRGRGVLLHAVAAKLRLAIHGSASR